MSGLWGARWSRWLASGLFLALCGIWLFANLDLRSTLIIIQHADAVKILLYLPFLILAVWIIRAVRWGVVLRSVGVSMDPLSVYLSTGTSLGLATITPAQSGEMIKIKHAAYASQLGLPAGVGGFAAERLYDFFVLLLLTILAALISLQSIAESFTSFAFIAIGAALAAAITLNVVPAAWLPAWMGEFLRAFKASTRRPVAAITLFGLTTTCWLLNALLWQVALSAVGVDVPLTASVAIVGIVMFTIVASTVPGGIGVSEITVSGLLIALGFTPEEALSGALVLRLLSLWAVVLGFIHWCFLESYFAHKRSTRL